MKKNKELDNKIKALFKKYKNKFKKINKYYEPIGGGYDIGMHLSDDEYEYLEYHYFGCETSIYVFFIQDQDKDINEMFKLYKKCQNQCIKLKPKHWSYYFEDYLLPNNFKKSNKNINKPSIYYYQYKGPKSTKKEMRHYLNTYYKSLKKHNVITNYKIRINFPKSIVL